MLSCSTNNPMVVDLKQDLPQGKVVPANNLPDDGEACPNLYFINPPTIVYACPDFEEGSAVDVSKLYDKYYSDVSFTVGDLTDCWWNFSDPYYVAIKKIVSTNPYLEIHIAGALTVFSKVSWKNLNFGDISKGTYYMEAYMPKKVIGGVLKERLVQHTFIVEDCRKR